MIQSTMAADSRQLNTAIIRMLALASAVADWIAITAFLASIVKQDSLLIFFMTVAAIAIAGIVYLLVPRVKLLPVLVVLIGSVVITIIAWSLLASSGVTPIKVNVINPQDGARVTMRYPVRGTVSDPDARVYVIVHPLTVPDMWVQQPPIVDSQGNWQNTVYFGTESLGIGDRYELIAVATHDNFLVTWATGNSLRKGQKVPMLPRKSNRSNLVTVTRPM